MTNDATLTPVEAPATQALALPCTGQALRTALLQRDLRTLNDLTRHLRIAGYRFEPLALAGALLQSGCAWVSDAFGHPVPVHVRVPMRPAPAPARPHEPAAAFTLAV